MKHIDPVAVPPRCSPLFWRALRLLWEAHPLPLRTHILCKATCCRPGASDATALKRAWRALNTLKTRGFVSYSKAPTSSGRPPAHWHLLEAGIGALLAAGHATQEEVHAKSSIHKAYRQLHKREHDLHVHEVKAEVLWLASKDPRVLVELLATEHVMDECAVVPDLAAVLDIAGQRLCVFFEVQGTAPRLSESQEKIRAYKEFLASGNAQTTFRTKNFRITFVTFSPDEHGGLDHRNNTLEAVGEVGGVDRLCYVATIMDVTSHGIAAPIWLRPADYYAALDTLPPSLRREFVDVRHAGNALRRDRDELVENRANKARLLG